MLNCDKTITLYHKTCDPEKRIDHYVPTVIRGCSWFAKMQSSVTEKGMVYANVYTVRIPIDHAPDEFVFSKGDYVLKGKVILDDPKPSDLLKHGEDVFQILSYSVNDEGSAATRHIRISGS